MTAAEEEEVIVGSVLQSVWELSTQYDKLTRDQFLDAFFHLTGSEFPCRALGVKSPLEFLITHVAGRNHAFSLARDDEHGYILTSLHQPSLARDDEHGSLLTGLHQPPSASLFETVRLGPPASRHLPSEKPPHPTSHSTVDDDEEEEELMRLRNRRVRPVTVDRSFTAIAYDKRGVKFVFVSAVTTPHDFAAQLCGDETSSRLAKMQALLKELYFETKIRRKCTPPPGFIKRGRSCVVELDALNYQRAVVLLAGDEQCQLLLVDSGHRVSLPSANVYCLDRYFYRLPAQAIQMCLGEVDAPPGGFSRSAGSLMTQLCPPTEPVFCKLLSAQCDKLVVSLVRTASANKDSVSPLNIAQELMRNEEAHANSVVHPKSRKLTNFPVVRWLASVMNHQQVDEAKSSNPSPSRCSSVTFSRWTEESLYCSAASQDEQPVGGDAAAGCDEPSPPEPGQSASPMDEVAALTLDCATQVEQRELCGLPLTLVQLRQHGWSVPLSHRLALTRESLDQIQPHELLCIPASSLGEWASELPGTGGNTRLTLSKLRPLYERLALCNPPPDQLHKLLFPFVANSPP